MPALVRPDYIIALTVSPGDDYIFHVHPPHQKVPKAKRLQDWYRALLTEAKKRRTIEDWADLNDFVAQHGITRAAEVCGLPFAVG